MSRTLMAGLCSFSEKQEEHMQCDDAYYAEVSKLARILHANKGNPLAGALDSWREAECIIRAHHSRRRKDHERPQCSAPVSL